MISLYLHSPFCVNKCGYCDFNSWEEVRVEPQRVWAQSLQRQSQFWSGQVLDAKTKKRPLIQTVFWGGGTPSLIENHLTQEVLTQIQKDWDLSEIQEFTIEVNPETLTLEKLELWSLLGINRLSMGVQTFDDLYLEKLERRARRKDNLRALELVAKSWNGSRGWSLDLMFGLPEQSLGQMENDLQLALEFSPSHVSSYQLTLTTARSENWKQPAEEILIEMMGKRKEILEQKGLFQYEISNFAKPGFESLHNKNYWLLNSFLGLGPGARGLLGPGFKIGSKNSDFGFHQTSPDHFESWSKLAGTLGELETLLPRTRGEHILERLMMGLRLTEGIRMSDFNAEISQAVFQDSERLKQKLIECRLESWAVDKIDFDGLNSGHLRLTPEGQLIIDTLVPKLAKIVEN
jgi:putative oxygen-independent coproporphyrinogen III oxidase